MLTLNLPIIPRAPQLGKGTVDYFPGPRLGEMPWETISHDVSALAAQGIPVTGVCGVGFCEVLQDEEGEAVVHELHAFYPWPGHSAEAELCLQRPPADFTVRVRGLRTPAELGTPGVFRDVVVAARAKVDAPMLCLESTGRRHDDLRSLEELRAAHPDRMEDVETRDILMGDGDKKVGCALLATSKRGQTEQHWVLFDARLPFDHVRVVTRTSGGFDSLHAFFDEMWANRSRSQVAFAHAVETVTHFGDVPW
ncbi:MAG: hypothetical protein H6741_26745 [Alphaproteobacteria bacterium]|nr:hypothetical protein [Alphaproteobacteria bacterium]